jgi:hypothetical protein
MCALLDPEIRQWLDGGPNAISNTIGYAEHYSRSHDAVIRVYDAAGCVINIQTEYEHRFLLPALS